MEEYPNLPFFVTRLLVGSSMIVPLAADSINTIGGENGRRITAEALGGISVHVGDVSSSVVAMVIGFGAESFLSVAGVNMKVARYAGIGVSSTLFVFIHWAELTGFRNTADVLDIPAIWLGFLGMACLLEIVSKRARALPEVSV